ncbi:hypothetical protein ACWEKM_17545 [Streptomyces sp. NPDC004752]
MGRAWQTWAARPCRSRPAPGANRAGRWDRLPFSAQGSVYEAWFPPARRPLDFGHADITLDPRTMTFRAELLLPGPVPAERRITAFRATHAA